MDLKPIEISSGINKSMKETMIGGGWKLDWIFSKGYEKLIVVILLLNAMWDIYRLISGGYF